MQLFLRNTHWNVCNMNAQCSFAPVQSDSKTPCIVASQMPLSMGFSRQEYWIGEPVPSPGESSGPGDQTGVSCIGRRILYHWATREARMAWHASAKPWQWAHGSVYIRTRLMVMDSRLLFLWNFPGKNTGLGCHSLLQGDLPNPGIEPKSPASLALAGRFFTTEPPGKSI